jgi:hypothetical protein
MDQESLNDTGPSWRCFKPTEAEEVPELPGLYAWYLNFINPQEFVDPKKFLAKYAQFAQSLNSDSEAEQKDPLGGNYVADLRGHGKFGDQYLAKLRIAHKLIEIDSDSARSVPDDAKDAAAQHILQQLFNDAFMIFAAPLYIGKTDNLKRRVEEHLTAIGDAGEVVERFGREQFVEYDNAKNFARRLAALNLKKGSLLFFCVPIDYQQLGITRAEATFWIEESEYYFNNISRPLLGRR